MLGSFFIDFNSFFASVEQQLDPKLRSRPVAVVPVMAETSCCIAASIEAKRLGIKTGIGVRDARVLCPDIVFVHAQHEKYVKVHHAAVAAVDRILPVRQVMSIDEMECELPRRLQSREQATQLAALMKREILTTVGDQLHTSIGVAPNTLIAKLASDMQKPNGLVIIERHEIPAKLLHLKPQDITGIGRNMLARLRNCGIHTVAQLYAAPKDLLRTIWGGVVGEEMYAKLRGVPYPPVRTESRSLGHSHILPPAMRNPADALAVLNRLTQKAAMRLRKQGFYATAMSVSVHVEYAYHASPGGLREARFSQTQDTGFFLASLQTLWMSGLQKLAQPHSVGMLLHGLVAAAQHTQPLFDSQTAAPSRPVKRPRQALLSTVDHLNRLYGKNALHFAAAHTALEHAPMRIAFNRIPDLETET